MDGNCAPFSCRVMTSPQTACRSRADSGPPAAPAQPVGSGCTWCSGTWPRASCTTGTASGECWRAGRVSRHLGGGALGGQHPLCPSHALGCSHPLYRCSHPLGRSHPLGCSCQALSLSSLYRGTVCGVGEKDPLGHRIPSRSRSFIFTYEYMTADAMCMGMPLEASCSYRHS